MEHIHASVDLSGTIFANEDPEIARKYLTSIIEQFEPGWLESPRGPLGVQWQSRGIYPVCYLNHLAELLYFLNTRITLRSVPLLREKIRGLLRSDAEETYEENLCELQATAMLAGWFKPISLEPLVPEDALSAPNRPRSPDIGIRLPEEDILFEVTVLRFGALAQWNKRIEWLCNDLQRAVLKHDVRREVTLDVPFSFREVELSRQQCRELCDQMVGSSVGEWRFETDHSELLITWTEIDHVLWTGVGFLSPTHESLVTGSVVTTAGPAALPAFSFRYRLVVDDNLEDLLFKSIRSTLKRKRTQCPSGFCYFLIIKLGDPKLLPQTLIHSLEARIWPNADFARFSGGILFRPRVEFEVDSPKPLMIMSLNPNAHKPAPNSFIQILSGKTAP